MVDGLVSIITPAYNAEKTISETINSVLKQSYENWEMIIIDDASKDSTVSVVEGYTDPRIKLIKSKENMGPAMAWNQGFKIMKGRYLAFVDADDVWEPDKLKDQISFMMDNQYSFTFTAYDWIDENSKPLNKVVHARKKHTYKSCLKDTDMGNSTVILDRSVIEIPQLPNVRYNNDGTLRFPIMKSGHNAYGIDKVYTHYRIMTNSVSRNKIKAAKNLWRIYADVLKIPIIPRCYYFAWYAFNAIKRNYFN